MKNIKGKNKFVLISLFICILCLMGVGVSYAYWKVVVSQDQSNVVISKCFNITMANQSNEINLNNAYPITDEEAKKLTPYSFTLTNTCSMSASYTLSLEMLNGTTLKSNYVAVLLNNGTKKLLSNYDNGLTTLANSTESRVLDTGLLLGGASKDYTLSLWLDEAVTLDDDVMNKTLKSKVVINAMATNTVVDKIISQLDTTGKCPSVDSDGKVTIVDNLETDSGYLCSAPDAYGTSYYYRGTVDNNYVYFADKYWRIVRINGDGSIRIIYDGTVAHANGENSNDRYIGKSQFNSDYNDNRYIGYMYGNSSGIASDSSQYATFNWPNEDSYYVSKEYVFDDASKLFTLKDPILLSGKEITDEYIGYYTFNKQSSTYASLYQITSIKTADTSVTVGYARVLNGTISKEEAQANINSSTIKKYLDKWYQNNILGTEYEQYLADNLFCDDRTIISGSGYGLSVTNYRWSSQSKIFLSCSSQNDAFTVSDTTKGNGALIYPIGLLSADEYFFAGGAYSYNKKFYLYTGDWEWLMSPFIFRVGGSTVTVQHFYGTFSNSYVNNSIWVRAVLNLKADIKLTGTGSISDPYHL